MNDTLEDILCGPGLIAQAALSIGATLAWGWKELPLKSLAAHLSYQKAGKSSEVFSNSHSQISDIERICLECMSDQGV